MLGRCRDLWSVRQALARVAGGRPDDRESCGFVLHLAPCARLRHPNGNSHHLSGWSGAVRRPAANERFLDKLGMTDCGSAGRRPAPDERVAFSIRQASVSSGIPSSDSGNPAPQFGGRERAGRDSMSLLRAAAIHAMPPLTRRFWPVTQAAASEARKATTSAMSAG